MMFVLTVHVGYVTGQCVYNANCLNHKRKNLMQTMTKNSSATIWHLVLSGTTQVVSSDEKTNRPHPHLKSGNLFWNLGFLKMDRPHIHIKGLRVTVSTC